MKKQNKIQWILVIALLFASIAADAQTEAGEAAQVVKDTGIEKKFETSQHGLNALKSKTGQAVGKELIAESQNCNKSFKGAKNFCIASLNSGMKGTVATVGLLVSAAGALTTMNASCSKFAEALKVAQLGLTAYNSMCGMAQQSCQSSCNTLGGSFKTKMGELQTTLNALQGAPEPAAQTEAKLLAGDITYLQAVQTDLIAVIGACEGYKMNIAAAGAGLTGILASSALNNSCKKETAAVDCTKDPMNAQCAKALDCSKPENAANTTCICQKTPNTAGCSGYAGSNQNQVNPTVDDTNADLEIPALNPNAGGTDPYAGPIPPSPTGNGVAPTGGGGGGGGLSGGGADGLNGAQKGKANGINTNILSGYEGGGGGGGGFRGGSSSGSMDSGLNAYLPNGSKDPARQPATQLFGNGQVTGAGSKSNFEKVNERYGEARSSLLGN